MPDQFQVLFGDGATAADDAFYANLGSIEVEENADLPGALQLTLPVGVQGAEGAEDLTLVGDAQLKPYARIAVVATPDGGTSACIFDGYVLSHKLHVERSTTSSSLQVWAQDASCLMNIKDQIKRWTDSDCRIARSLFEHYGFTAEVDTQEDSPQHSEDGYVLVQRATDAQFLRDRARRNGKLFRVACADRAGRVTGYFIKPRLDQSATATLTLNPNDDANVDALDFEWDVARPATALGQVLLDAREPQKTRATQSGLAIMDARSLADFIDDDRHVGEAQLTTAVGSGEELRQRATSLLREAGWFVKCQGEGDLSRIRTVLRAATVVQVNGAGRLHSGKYFVWSVRHTITAQAHSMRFVLVRNAVGAAGAS